MYKKISLLLLTVLFMYGGICAQGPSRNVYIMPSANMNITSVVLSSSVATQILSTRASRKAFSIQNQSASSYEVAIATYAAVSSSGLWILAAEGAGGGQDTYKDNVQCYNGAIYVLGAAGISTSTVRVIEKY